jgi:hypothetical protein
MNVKWIINGVEQDVIPTSGAVGFISSACSGVVDFQPIPVPEQMVSVGFYNEVFKLWIDARTENEQLRKELAELKARQS